MKSEIFSSTKAILVDYYGTLVDVGHPFAEIQQWFTDTYAGFTDNTNCIYMAFYKEHVRLLCSNEFYLGQVLLMKSYRVSCDKYNIPFYPEVFQKLIIKLFTQPPAFSGAQRTIENLRRYFPVLLLTNADNKILYESIKKQKFEFDYILSSEDLQCNKPNTQMFLSACKILNVPVINTLMIGDSLTEDIYSATSIGMQAIWINAKKSKETESVLQLTSICEIEQLL